MGDIEANVQTGVKRSGSINLFLRTIFHFFSFVLFVFVLSWGLKIWIMISDEQADHPLLKDLKVLSPFFFTNWNFLFFHGFELALVLVVILWGVSIVYFITDDGGLPDSIRIVKYYSNFYLTNWNLIFQTVFLCLSLAHDVLEWGGKQNSSAATKIKYWRDVIFCGMALPYTLFVTSMFWCVYAIDRELVFPTIYDQVVPWWFNHCVHTNITIVLIIETLLQARRNPTNKRLELILYWTIGFSYAAVYYTIYFITGRWLYQVFGTMNWWQICLYQFLIWVGSYIFYVIQFPINRLFHGPEDNESKTESTGENENFTEEKENENTPKTNGTKAIEDDNVIDLKTSPFSTEKWSLKLRNNKNQFENSRL